MNQAFDAAKKSMKEKISAGVDYSPKGSIDALITHVVNFINELQDFATTSSCSGRISIFRDDNNCKGIKWLLVMHGVITVDELKDAILSQDECVAKENHIVLKCEPFILHIRCRDIESGRKLHQIALESGFRETGLTLGQKMIHVAVRTTAFAMEMPIAIGRKLLLDDFALNVITSEANRRLLANFSRIDRFLVALKDAWGWPMLKQPINPMTPPGVVSVQRWGHSCLILQAESCVHTSRPSFSIAVIGGYGVNKVVDKNTSAIPSASTQDSRKLDGLLFSNSECGSFEVRRISENPRNSCDNIQSGLGLDRLMHAEASVFTVGASVFVLIFGGRDSPQKARFPSTVVYQISDDLGGNKEDGMPRAALAVPATDSESEYRAHRAKGLFGAKSATRVPSEWRPVAFTEVGEVPPPRWGHTLNFLDDQHFFLFGGRDECKIFGDGYLLSITTIVEDDDDCVSTDTSPRGMLQLSWRKLFDSAELPRQEWSASMSVCPSDGAVLPAPRFFHAASVVHLAIRPCDLPKYRESPLGQTHGAKERVDVCVLVHGGLLSLEDPITCGYFFRYSVSTQTCCILQSDGGKFRSVPRQSAIDGSSDFASHNCSDNLDSGSSVPGDDMRNDVLSLRRFGHSLTDIGARSLLIAGGTSFNCDEYQECGILELRLQTTPDGSLHGSLRPVPIVFPTVSSDNVEVELEVEDIRNLRIDAAAPQKLFPCNDCRVHHRAVLCPPSSSSSSSCKVLHLIGGGAACLAFGSHYCSCVATEIVAEAYAFRSHEIKDGKSGSHIKGRREVCGNGKAGASQETKSLVRERAVSRNGEGGDGLIKKNEDNTNVFVPMEAQEDVDVLLVATQYVKSVKIFLEAHKWLDKRRRISSSIVSPEDAMTVVLPAATMAACVAAATAVVQREDNLSKISEERGDNQDGLVAGEPAVSVGNECKQEKKRREKGTTKDCRGKDRSKGKDYSIQDSKISPEIMAMPITSMLADQLHAGNLAGELQVALALCLGYLEAVGAAHSTEESENERPPIADTPAVVFVGKQRVRASKTIINDGNRRANAYLEDVARSYGLDPAMAVAELPQKYEIVGDVLMIPEDSLNGRIWQSLLDNGLSNEDDTIATSKMAMDIWQGLAACFGVSRVARKARVDRGPRRSSHVRLLLPPLGRPETTGCGAAGWVEVIENGITFGFDITRVMFCSGNVTERIRMGRENLSGQVIVDLYCGIGYYTLPMLVHGRAAHVHACEWNPDSILALRENLRRAGVDDRCTFYEGDNKATAPKLVGIADRVCLGLLPSSVEGWPLATTILKPTGGVLYVHENVLESEIEEWVTKACRTFEGLFASLQNDEAKRTPIGNFSEIVSRHCAMTVQCRKVEKVKSYAPRVLHIVAELVCSPLIQLTASTAI